MNITIVTAVAAYLVAAFPSTPLHPHHPKSIVIGGAAGKVTISYFTVPFNAKHLKGKPHPKSAKVLGQFRRYCCGGRGPNVNGILHIVRTGSV